MGYAAVAAAASTSPPYLEPIPPYCPTGAKSTVAARHLPACLGKRSARSTHLGQPQAPGWRAQRLEAKRRPLIHLTTHRTLPCLPQPWFHLGNVLVPCLCSLPAHHAPTSPVSVRCCQCRHRGLPHKARTRKRKGAWAAWCHKKRSSGYHCGRGHIVVQTCRLERR